ncbi:MAG: preprotein translocase subunit SecE [Oscillospiraceae bacterium]|nr:preprotein translocase subunit SecE [Oscillospiraceae bacterium]
MKNKEKSTGGLSRWFSEAKSELKKATWPNKQQVINNTNVVFLMIIVFGLLVGIFDTGLMSVLNFILDKAR